MAACPDVGFDRRDGRPRELAPARSSRTKERAHLVTRLEHRAGDPRGQRRRRRAGRRADREWRRVLLRPRPGRRRRQPAGDRTVRAGADPRREGLGRSIPARAAVRDGQAGGRRGQRRGGRCGPVVGDGCGYPNRGRHGAPAPRVPAGRHLARRRPHVVASDARRSRGRDAIPARVSLRRGRRGAAPRARVRGRPGGSARRHACSSSAKRSRRRRRWPCDARSVWSPEHHWSPTSTHG